MARRGNKFNAVRTSVDGIVFDSKREAQRYIDLCILRRAGEIRDLELQTRYVLEVNGQRITTYRADFKYFDERTKEVTVEDCKGHKTREYIIKKKLMKAILGVQILET